MEGLSEWKGAGVMGSERKGAVEGADSSERVPNDTPSIKQKVALALVQSRFHWQRMSLTDNW